MDEKKKGRAPYTTKEFFNIVIDILRENGLIPKEIEYVLPEREEEQILNTSFSFITDLDFGGSEGTYLDIGLRNFNKNEASTYRIGTIKTLEDSREAMEYMGKLAGDFIYEGRNYVNKHYDDFDRNGFKVTGILSNGDKLPFYYTPFTATEARRRRDELFNSTKYDVCKVIIQDNMTQEEKLFLRESKQDNTFLKGNITIHTPFQTRYFDEDDGWVTRNIETGTYDFRILDINGWKPRQLLINDEWMDVAGECEELEIFLENIKKAAYKKSCHNCQNRQFPCAWGPGICMEYEMCDDPVKEAGRCTRYEYDPGQAEEYTPSATAGDYSPSCPWNAPGMSIRDFI